MSTPQTPHNPSKYSSQHIENQSFDDVYNVRKHAMLAYQASTDSYVPVNVDSSGNLSTTSSGGGIDANVNLNEVGGAAFGLGQSTASASLPVTIASDQPPIPAQQKDVTATGTLAGANQTVVSPILTGVSTVSIQVTGTWAGTITPQVSLDGVNWVSMGATALLNVSTQVYSATIPSAAVAIYQADIAGFNYFQVKETAYTSGTANISLRFSNATGLIALDNPIPTGTNNIGAITGTVTAKPSLPVLVTGQTTSNTSQVQLNATSHVVTNGVIVKALSTNTASVFVGVSGVTTTTGYELTAGQSVTLYPSNSNVIYIIGANTTDKVSWVVT